jgi:hypothetical protein
MILNHLMRQILRTLVLRNINFHPAIYGQRTHKLAVTITTQHNTTPVHSSSSLLAVHLQCTVHAERRRVIYVYRSIEARSCTRCCSGKAISITYSECVPVALGIQHAQRMRHIILSSVACLALLCFSIFSHKRHDFRGEKSLERELCVLTLSTSLSENFLILRIIQRYMIRNVCRSSFKVPVILVRF